MAVKARMEDKSWYLYQPEWSENRSPHEEDPLILEIRFITHATNLRYADSVKMGRRNKVKPGEILRLSDKKLKENVKIISGWYLIDEKNKEAPSTDINWFVKWSEQDLIDEIDDAMTRREVLESGNPNLFKLKK